MSTNHITVNGIPVAKGRPRFAMTRRGMRTYTPDRTVAAENEIVAAALKQWKGPPLEGPVKLLIVFLMPRPKRMAKSASWLYHVKKPDCDNLVKTVCDALNGIAWKDDSQVCRLTAEKCYSDVPRTTITVETL